MSALTYAEVGATRHLPLPAGYAHLVRRERVGDGSAALRVAAARLARWEPQRGAGLDVRTDAEVAAPGVRFATGVRIGPLRIWAPCEIVWLVDTGAEYGFGFGTLPGHPEIGEEAFLLTLDDDGALWFEVRAFSRPGPWWVRLGAPVARLVQLRVTGRYVNAMRRATG